MDSVDCVDFLHLYSCDPLKMTVPVELVAVGVDAAAAAAAAVVAVVVVAAAAATAAVDHLILYGYSKFESCKSHVAYVACVEYVVFSVFLDFLHSVVDLASPDYSQ